MSNQNKTHGLKGFKALRNLFAGLALCGLVLSTNSIAVSYAQEETAAEDAVSSKLAKRNPLQLSMNSAVLFALNNNPNIEIYWSRYQQAKSLIGENNSAFYPSIDLSLSAGQEFRDPSAGTNPAKADINYNTSYGLTLQQTIFDGFKALENVRSSEKMSEAAFWKTQSTIQNVISETVQVYLDILSYQQEVKLTEEIIVDIAQTLQYIGQRVAAGATEKVVMDYANSRKSFADTELRRAQSSLNDAISKMEFLTGKLPPEFLTYYPEELYPDKLDLQFYLDHMAKHNASLVSSDYEIESMQHTLEAEKSKNFPTVSLGLAANEKHNNGGNIGRERELSATVDLTYNIFDGFKNQYAQQRIVGQIDELAIKKTQVEKEIRRDIKLAYNQVVATFNAIDTTDAEIVASAQLKELNEESFKQGNINIIELIESAERLKQAKVRRVGLETDLYYNSYQLLLLSNMIDQEFFCASC